MEKRRINIWKLGILLIVALCAVSIAPAATAHGTPFVIYGYVSNANGTECDNPNVNITNMDTGSSKTAENTSGSNCYLLVLANGTDLNASETLRFEVTSPDGSQSKIVECKVTENEVDDGGRFDYNITLSVPSQQTWYFSTNEASAPIYDGADYNKTMTKGIEGGMDTYISLPPGERVWFYPDQVADCNVSFPADTWNVSYWVNATDFADSDKQINTSLRGIDSTGAELSGSPYAEGYYDIKSQQNLEEVTGFLNPAGFTIPEGGRFAIEVLWAGDANGSLELYCNPPEKHSTIKLESLGILTY